MVLNMKKSEQFLKNHQRTKYGYTTYVLVGDEGEIFRDICKGEAIEELQDKDALAYLTECSNTVHNEHWEHVRNNTALTHKVVSLDDSKKALSIQQANSENKAVEAFINYMRIFPGYTGYYIERQVEKFKQQLKTK